MKNSIILLVMLTVALFFVAGCDAEPETVTDTDDTVDTVEEAAYMDISVVVASDLMDTTSDLIIIDVSPLYDQGHLPNAISYYVGDGSLDAAIPTLDKQAPYLVYCHTDSASIAGAQKLIDAGFTTVYRLEGNFGAWVDAGYPIEE